MSKPSTRSLPSPGRRRLVWNSEVILMQFSIHRFAVLLIASFTLWVSAQEDHGWRAGGLARASRL